MPEQLDPRRVSGTFGETGFLGMTFLDFVVLAVPALIGLLAALVAGPTRGVVSGSVAALVAVFILLLFQVSPPTEGPGSETGRFSYAAGLMRFELVRWGPAFLVGAAIGSIIFRLRRSNA